jgi:hypothetical protein
MFRGRRMRMLIWRMIELRLRRDGTRGGESTSAANIAERLGHLYAWYRSYSLPGN